MRTLTTLPILALLGTLSGCADLSLYGRGPDMSARNAPEVLPGGIGYGRSTAPQGLAIGETMPRVGTGGGEIDESVLDTDDGLEGREDPLADADNPLFGDDGFSGDDGVLD